MPKVLTPTKRQEIALLAAIERGKLATGLPRDQHVAARLGLHQSTYSVMKKAGFRTMRLFTLRKMAQVAQARQRAHMVQARQRAHGVQARQRATTA